MSPRRIFQFRARADHREERKCCTVYYFALIDPILLPVASIIGHRVEYFIVSLALLIGQLYDLNRARARIDRGVFTAN